MRFSDSTNYIIPKPIKYANSDSSPFNSDDSLSDDNSSQDNLTSPTPSDYNNDFSSQHNSLTKMNDNLLFKQRIKTPQQNPPIDISPHQSQNQSILLNPNIERATKSHYNLRQQPKNDYRLFIPPSNL